MKLKFLGFLAIALLATISCQKDSGELSDAQLIEAIQKAGNKQNIEISELPTGCINILKQEYTEEIDVAKLAPKLGYEVDLIQVAGPKAAKLKQAYFDLSGRILNGDKGGDGDKDGKERCFELIYPVTYIMPNETEITINGKDDTEGWSEIKAWYEAHPDVIQKPVLQFPVDIKLKNGTIVTINNREEMRRAKRRCKGDGGDKERCFEFIYPVTYIMPDGTEITVNGEDDGSWAEIKAWYEDHPDVKKRPAIKFPVDIEWKSGRVVTLNGPEDMRRAKRICNGEGGDNKICFELIYPVTYIMPDGTEIIVPTNDDEGWAEIKAWYAAHPDVNKRPVIKFPVDIKFMDNDAVITINNRQQMRRAREACNDKD